MRYSLCRSAASFVLNAAVTGLLLVNLIGCAVPTESVAFDAAAWREEPSIGMAYDIERRSIVQSMTIDQVEDLLGPPDLDSDQVRAYGEGGINYWLPHGWELFLQFEGGVVTAMSVREP